MAGLEAARGAADSLFTDICLQRIRCAPTSSVSGRVVLRMRFLDEALGREFGEEPVEHLDRLTAIEAADRHEILNQFVDAGGAIADLPQRSRHVVESVHAPLDGVPQHGFSVEDDPGHVVAASGPHVPAGTRVGHTVMVAVVGDRAGRPDRRASVLLAVGAR